MTMEIVQKTRQTRSCFTASDGVEISYIDVGEGVPFLWIHGWGGDAETQQPILELLSQFGFRCLCYDQRCCGRSAFTDNLGVPQSARDAVELLEHLEIDDAVVLGYSMGAAVLFSYLEQFGTAHISRLIIGDMSPKPINDEEWKLGIYQGWYTQAQLERDLYNMDHNYEAFSAFFAEQTMFTHTPDEYRGFDESPEFAAQAREKARAAGKEELFNRLMAPPPKENRRANRIYWESCDSRDYRSCLDRIDVPTALFYANPGSLYRPEIAFWIAERISNSVIHIFDGCTHLASGEKPLEFVSAIVDFVGKA